MSVLSGLSPQRVLFYFEQICAIPHGSGNCAALSAYCESVASGLGLSVLRDEWDNVVIRKPASPGYEDHPTVILQGHLDMVCEKETGCSFDFERDGLKLFVDGDWIGAAGTTLGGDDGIAIAMALAVLEDDALPHPPLEAVFTVNEETGMDGAAGIDPALLKGRILLNIDSECEGVLTVSCAGGARAELKLPLRSVPNDRPCKGVSFQGLKGGHSGVEIHKGRLNADILMGIFLSELPSDVRTVSLFGGTKDNAIPSAAECVLATDRDLSLFAEAFSARFRPENDGGLSVTVRDAEARSRCFDAESTLRIAGFLTAVPNGVRAMSKKIEGLVETSLNLGQLWTEDDALTASFLVRSSVNLEKQRVLDQLKETSARFGGSFEADSPYPAWEFKEDSRLRSVMIRVYETLFGKSPVVEAIHAGLECGFFCDKLPGLDAVSFGPDILEIHTPRERLSVSSVARTYQYLRSVLAEL